MEMHIPKSSRWRDETGVLHRGELDRPRVTIWLDDSWVAEVAIGAQDGALVVEGVEIRLAPVEIDAAQFEGGSIALPTMPSGGLPLRTARSLTLSAALDFARECLAQTGDYTLARHGISRTTLDAPRFPGKRGRSDRYYAEIASAYVRAVESGSRHPAADVAGQMGDTSQYIRTVLMTARKRGLLTPARPGTSSGTLTAKGRTALGQN
jgi:hypothetical protein